MFHLEDLFVFNLLSKLNKMHVQQSMPRFVLYQQYTFHHFEYILHLQDNRLWTIRNDYHIYHMLHIRHLINLVLWYRLDRIQ
jgi:hypothetical protein